MTHDQTTPAPVEVTQADREAAAAWARMRGRPHLAANMRRGSCDTAPLVLAFARHRIARTAPAGEVEPVLRWEGDKLYVGEHYVSRVCNGITCWWFEDLLARQRGGCLDETEARTAAEQAVRDWLARAGLYAHPPASPTADLLVEALWEAREAIHHRGGPLCSSRYYSASRCDCGTADAIAKIDAALAKHGGA